MAKSKSENGNHVVATIPAMPAVALPTAVGFVDAGSTVRAPYLAFPNANSGKISGSGKWLQYKMQHPDLQEFEPVVVVPTALGDELIRVASGMTSGMTFSAFYIGGFHCWAQFDMTTGKPIAASTNEPMDARHLGFTEYSEAVLLTKGPHGLIPARASFQKAMARVGHAGAMALQLLTTNPEEWLKHRPKFADAMRVPNPAYRFKINVTVTTPVAKASGFRYPAPLINIVPSDVADWKALAEANASETFCAEVQAVQRAYSEKLAEVQNLLDKSQNAT